MKQGFGCSSGPRRWITAAALCFTFSLACAAGRAVAQTTSAPDNNPHMLFTEPRPANPVDEQRGQQILATLRPALSQYRDYRAAEKAGYKAYYLNVPMPVYHFASSWYGFKETLRFDPTAPTALLYRKNGTGFELIGVMYYAPGYFSPDQLNARIPLSLVRWHRQIDICLPPGGAEASNDKRFGSDGTITTQAACAAAGGSWNATLHGWMVEVYPFAKTPAAIWAYRASSE